jgi:catechol 2,3-dioxygenase
MTEPCHDVAHLGHVEVFTDRFDDSLAFYTGPYGLKLSALEGDSAYLRAWDDYEFHTLKLTRHHTTGVGHIGYRVASQAALDRRVRAIEGSGYIAHGWTDGRRGARARLPVRGPVRPCVRTLLGDPALSGRSDMRTARR